MELQILEIVNTKAVIPKKVFIVPYRNRIQHKFFFSRYMTFLLEDEQPGDYEIYFAHQSDDRPFNRGATKNIGFLAMKNKYPNNYLKIDFIFNDVDTMPFNKIFEYSTTPGVVKHLYGFTFALGGIVIFKGKDFEAINGYPNYWGWGMEDNVLQQRCMKSGLIIDRTQFYPLGDQHVLQLFEGIKRVVINGAKANAVQDNGVDGLYTIFGLIYSISNVSDNPDDNVSVVDNIYINVINIKSFQCSTSPNDHTFENYDLRDKRVITKPGPMNFMFLNNTQQQQQPVQRTVARTRTGRMGMGGLM
jgi:hypothetical protein